MAEITTSLYTGRGLATELPKDTGRSTERLSDFILKSEELKYNAFRENEQEFLKNSQIDPAFFISTANQKAQAGMLDEYNKKWAGVMKESNNNMTTDQKQQMLAEKNLIISQQQGMQADMERALQDFAIIQKDIQGNYDKDAFYKRFQGYMGGGERYGQAPLTPQAIDPDYYYKKTINKGHGTKGTISVTKKVGTDLVTTKAVASGTEEEGRAIVEADMLSNERLLMGYVNKFLALPEEEKRQRLDVDKNGVVSPQEAQDTNPIIEWAKDTYWQQALIIEEAEVTKPQTTVAPKKTFGITVNIGGTDLTVSPANKREGSVTYGDKTFNDTYAFSGNTTLSNIPTQGGLRVRGTSTRDLAKGNITGKLKDYVLDGDYVVIEASTGIPELDIETKGLVIIPRNNIVGADNLPITKDGKQTTIGELRGGGGAATTAKPTFNEWRKIAGNENKTFTDYTNAVR